MEAVANGEFKIVIGTQLVAKGHNFPFLSLVGVVDADLGLASGDPRAAERTFQILQQVTGRAGRGDTAGRALLQSFQPGHPVMKALISGDTEQFYAEEIRAAAGGGPAALRPPRRAGGERRGPPSRRRARALVRVAEPPAEVMVLGPAEAPIAVVRGRHRFRILVKTEREFDLQTYLRQWLIRGPKLTGNTKVSVDVDPMSFL